MSKPNYILNKVNNDANLTIDGEISKWWGVGLEQVRNELSNMNATNIMVQITSNGGSVTEGRAIASFISGYPVPIDTNGIGLVASIATIILLAGKNVTMAKGSMFMIHNPSIEMFGGESKDLRKAADLLDMMHEELANTYVDSIEKNNKLINGSREETKKQVSKWMANETWFTAQQALDNGFITEVTDGAKFLNKANALEMYNSCKGFKNAPADFLNQIKNVVDMADTPIVDEKVNFWDSFKAMFFANKAEVKALINGLENDEQAEKLAKIEEAKQIAKDNGFFKEEIAIEIPAVEETAENKQIAEMTAKIDAANKRIQEMEEANLSPSAGDTKADVTKNKVNLYAPSKEHEEAVNSFAEIFKFK